MLKAKVKELESMIEVYKLKINKFKFQAQMYKMKMLGCKKKEPLEVINQVIEMSANSIISTVSSAGIGSEGSQSVESQKEKYQD